MINVAVIGAGEWGLNYLRVLNDLGVLGAVCEIHEQRKSKVAQLYPSLPVISSLDAILKNPEVSAIVIATPPSTHYHIANECLTKGKDVLIEKPLALSVAEGEDLVQRAMEGNRILMVGHLLQYHPAFVQLRELVRNGELGKIQYLYSNRLNFGKIRIVENILWSFAPHDISMMLALVGEMPEEVSAHGTNYLNDSVADVTLTNLKFPSGVNAHLFVSWLHPFKEQKLVVIGEEKMVVFNDTAVEDKLVIYPHKVNWVSGIPVAQKAEALRIPVELKEPLKEEVLHFLECIKTRKFPRTNGEEGLRVLEVLTACQESLDRGGERVRVRSVPSE